MISYDVVKIWCYENKIHYLFLIKPNHKSKNHLEILTIILPDSEAKSLVTMQSSY